MEKDAVNIVLVFINMFMYYKKLDKVDEGRSDV